MLKREEDAFNKTLDKGIALFESEIANSITAISGAFAFRLYDEQGFPIDLTELMARERGMTVDTFGFEKLMEGQKNRGKAALQKKEHELFGGTRDAAFGDSVVLNVLANIFSLDTKTGDFRSVWTVERNWDNRTSLITDPPHGRLPAMTPEGQKRRDAAQAALSRPADGPEDRGFQERCITYGSPQLMAGYQTYYQIVQTSTAVIFLTEMIHDARAIPLDGRPHLPSAIHEWLGDSRGQWERDTLVVDTTNYKPRSFMSTSSEKLHVIERLSRTGPDSLKYEITIDDPGTWTKPWSLMIPLKRSPNPIYEYACHEGNERSLAGILAGARADEQAAARSGSGGLK